MKLLNKKHAKLASLPKLEKAKRYIEKLIRKKDLLGSYNNQVTDSIKSVYIDAIQASNFCPAKVEIIKDTGKPLIFVKQAGSDNNLTPNTKLIILRCNLLKDHEGNHQAFNPFSDSDGMKIGWNDNLSIKDLCTEYCYPATNDDILHKVQCILSEFHQGKHKGKRPNSNEYFLWSIDSNVIESIEDSSSTKSFPTSENRPSFSRDSENKPVIALAVCNKEFSDGSGKLLYCLDDFDHDGYCGDYSPYALMIKLSERLMQINKQLKDKTI